MIKSLIGLVFIHCCSSQKTLRINEFRSGFFFSTTTWQKPWQVLICAFVGWQSPDVASSPLSRVGLLSAAALQPRRGAWGVVTWCELTGGTVGSDSRGPVPPLWPWTHRCRESSEGFGWVFKKKRHFRLILELTITPPTQGTAELKGV